MSGSPTAHGQKSSAMRFMCFMALVLVPGLTLQILDVHKAVDLQEIKRVTMSVAEQTTNSILSASASFIPDEQEEEAASQERNLLAPRPRYYQVADNFTERVGFNNYPSYHDATVIKRAPWMPRRPIMCKETCCVEAVAISLQQDETKIINTVDGKDLADITFDHHEDPWQPHLKYHSVGFHEELIPCLLPGTIFQMDNHMIDMDYFFDVVRPQIQVPYVLMTTFCDAPSPQVRGREIADPLLLKWYGLNPEDDPSEEFQQHKDKFVPYPLGLSYQHPQEKHLLPYLQHTNFTNPFMNLSSNPRYDFTQQPLDWDRDVFVHFGLLKEHRKHLWSFLCANATNVTGVSCNQETNKIPPPQIYQDMSRYRFVLSPPGNGWDCYRTYEALLLGLIPIIDEKAPYSQQLFEGLPVIQMDDLNHATSKQQIAQVIQDWIDSEAFTNTSYDAGWERLFLKYRRRQVLEAAGRTKEILKDEFGREYYQGYRYTFKDNDDNHKDIFCDREGKCEVPQEKRGQSWKATAEAQLTQEDREWLDKWNQKPFRRRRRRRQR